MRKLKTTIIFLILVSSVAAQSVIARTHFTRPTFEANLRSKAPIWRVKIFEDENYIFVKGDSASKNCGYLANVFCDIGLFLYAKKDDKWLTVKKLSTENAKLGRSPSINEVALSVSWDYKALSKVNYVGVNLQTTASNNYPDNIEYDTSNKAYRLKYNSSFGEETLTVFWMLEEEINKKFN